MNELLEDYVSDVIEDIDCNIIHSHDELRKRIPINKAKIESAIKLQELMKVGVGVCLKNKMYNTAEYIQRLIEISEK